MSKIAILEDYALFCSGIKPVIEKNSVYEVVVEAKNHLEFLTALRESSPDLIIFDVIHCANNGVASIKKIKRKAPKTPMLLVVNSALSDLFQDYISLGVNGIVFSSSSHEDLLEAVNVLLRGEDYFPSKVWVMVKNFLRTKRLDFSSAQDERQQLTNREIDILRLFCKGMTYKEIGARLNISPRTVETHKKNISTKINAKSTAEMVEFAIQNNLSSVGI